MLRKMNTLHISLCVICYSATARKAVARGREWRAALSSKCVMSAWCVFSWNPDQSRQPELGPAWPVRGRQCHRAECGVRQHTTSLTTWSWLLTPEAGHQPSGSDVRGVIVMCSLCFMDVWAEQQVSSVVLWVFLSKVRLLRCTPSSANVKCVVWTLWTQDSWKLSRTCQSSEYQLLINCVTVGASPPAPAPLIWSMLWKAGLALACLRLEARLPGKARLSPI